MRFIAFCIDVGIMAAALCGFGIVFMFLLLTIPNELYALSTIPVLIAVLYYFFLRDTRRRSLGSARPISWS